MMNADQLASTAIAEHQGLPADTAESIAKAVINAGSFRGTLMSQQSLRQRERQLRRSAIRAAFDATNAPAWIRLLGIAAKFLPGPIGLAVTAALWIVNKLIED